MKRSMRQLTASLAAMLVLTACAWAHFPFIVVDQGGATAKLIMSETLTPDSEVSINILSGAKLMLRDADGKDTPLSLEAGSEWMSMALPGSGTRVVHGIADLGFMQRGTSKPHVLIYYPKSIIGDACDAKTVLGDRVPVELIPVRGEDGMRLKLIIDGKPAAKSPLRIVLPDSEEKELTTDDAGLSPVISTTGMHGAWARHWVDQPGERDGKKYEQVRHYATLVFNVENATSPQAKPVDNATQRSSSTAQRTPLPRAIASFGAVESDGWLYVYGGHAADRHEYSTASVSGRFSRLNLREPGAAWEQLPGGVPVQGMNLASHAGKVYRVGGMEPRNEPGKPSDNHSIAEAACFDPAKGQWTTLASLPRPRSSHDVVAVNNKLLVIGGWWMKGADQGSDWLDTIDWLDLTSEGASWESIPQPVQRRALITATLGDNIFVMGGFDSDDTPLLDVDILHLSNKAWSKGPSIPGKSMNGFAPAAAVHDGHVYLSVGTGEMFRLRKDWTAWEPFAATTPRIVHRMVSWNDELIVIGGAADAKMTNLVEVVPVQAATAAMGKLAPIPAAKPEENARGGDARAKSFSKRMRDIDKAMNKLKVLDRDAWAPPAHHASIDANAEIQKMVHGLSGLESDEIVKEHPEDFLTMLKTSEESVKSLQAMLASNNRDGEALSKQFKLVIASCKECHVAYRD